MFAQIVGKSNSVRLEKPNAGCNSMYKQSSSILKLILVHKRSVQ